MVHQALFAELSGAPHALQVVAALQSMNDPVWGLHETEQRWTFTWTVIPLIMPYCVFQGIDDDCGMTTSCLEGQIACTHVGASN